MPSNTHFCFAKPHFYYEIGGAFPKISAGFPEKLLPVLRIRKEKTNFATENAADYIPNLRNSSQISYESEV